jgi:hypothetical protein
MDVKVSELDTHERGFVKNVRDHGWAGTHVFEDDEGAGFSYSTGFWRKFQTPELVLFSLPREIAHQILWNLYKDMEDGKRFENGTPISEVLDGYDVVLKPVLQEHFSEYLGWNRWFYGGDNFQAQQVFFPNKDGQFPWDAAASPEFTATQPDLTKPSN